MANPIPAGSDVSAGTYRCTNCGYELDVGSTKHLPPCPSCRNGEWHAMSGGDSAQDPYPDRPQAARTDRSRADTSEEADAGSDATKANPIEVQKFLAGVDYPTGKRELEDEARRQGAGETVRSTLARLPERRFADPSEVSAAIGELAG